MSNSKTNLFITIEGDQRRMRVSKDVIKILGMPSHICLYQTENCDSIAIGPCDEKNVMSFQVPEKFLRGERCDYKINSTPYIRMIAEVNGLEHGKSYRLNGVYREGKNIVTFAVNQNNAAL